MKLQDIIEAEDVDYALLLETNCDNVNKGCIKILGQL
jgi:hypothetical protein